MNAEKWLAPCAVCLLFSSWASCVYLQNADGLLHKGAIVDKKGSFLWDGDPVDYRSRSRVTTGGRVLISASAGDYEIVSFGASHGMGAGKVNQYFDEQKMTAQGFRKIGVRGEEDRKVEMWIRKNSGQKEIAIPQDARACSFLVLEGTDVQLDLENIRVATVNRAGDSYKVPRSGAEGLKILTYFSDDSVELTRIGKGTLVFQEWGFGDGDGFALALYPPGIEPPGQVEVVNHDPGGRQYVGLLATFFK